MKDQSDLRKHLGKALARGARSGVPVAAAAREVFDQLAAVLVPLVSEEGFAALVARAFHLARREYPSAGPDAAAARDAEPFVEIGLWLERLDRSIAIDATAALFDALASLLINLIGESLTTRYLQRAWPEGFSARRSKGKRP